MAFITLIIAPGLAALELDAVISENHQADTDVTEHPVEAGADVTDHARTKPDTYTLEGLVSDTPINRAQGQRTVSARGVTFESTAAQDAPVGAPGYAKAAYEKLLEIRNTKQLVTVVTELRTYRQMMMLNLSVPRDAQTGDALRFSATFRQMTLAEVRKKEVTVAREPKAKKKVGVGKNVAKETEAPKSLLYKGKETETGTKVFNWTKNLLGGG